MHHITCGKISRVTLISLLFGTILFFQNCSPYHEEDAGKNLNSESGLQKFRCENPQTRGVKRDSSRRLTLHELKQTVLTLFGPEIQKQVLNSLNLYPSDTINESITEFTPNMVQSHINGIEALAFSIPEAILSNRTLSEKFLPNCMFSNTNNLELVLNDDQCNQSLIQDLGFKIYRRPMTQEEQQPYLSLLSTSDDSFTNNKEKVSAVISAMLLSPHFSHLLIHLDTQEGSRSKVDNYTLASRISYTAAGTMPDKKLFHAAEQGDLILHTSREQHARRILNSDTGRNHIRHIFNTYLHLDSVSTPNEQYAKFIGINTENLINDLKKEALDFVEHIVFEEKGNFESLMLSAKAFPPSSNSAKLFNVQGVSQDIRDPKIVATSRKGLFMRPILMISPEPRTSPIHRGYIFSKTALCMVIPPPSPDLLSIGEQLAMELNPQEVSASEEAEYVTSPVSCQGCHVHINPSGHAFERFGAFGDIREAESIFDGNGKFVRTLPFQQSATFVLDDQEYLVQSPEEMMGLVAQSAGGQGCFAQQVLRYTRYTLDSKEDSCHLAQIEKSIRQKSPLIDVFVQNAASEDQLWQR